MVEDHVSSDKRSRATCVMVGPSRRRPRALAADEPTVTSRLAQVV